MFLRPAALALTIANCTIVIEPPADDEVEPTTAAMSFPELAGESSSTGEIESGDSSTGREIGTSTGEMTGTSTTDEIIGESTGDGSTTTSGMTTGESTSTGEDTTTSGMTTESTSTGEDTTTSGDMGEPCSQDSDCVSNFCIGGGFNGDVPRCSAFCWPGTATDCHEALGHPGLCTWGGGDSYYCTGVWDFDVQDLRSVTFDPDVESLYYQSSGYLKDAADRHAYLVPPQQAAFYVELTSIDEPGYGDGAVDVFASDGTLLGTVAVGEPQSVTIEPKGIHAHHWLIVRPNDGKKVSYQLWLKEPCWPNC